MWFLHDTALVYRPDTLGVTSKVAGLDLDWTLTRPIDAMYSNRANRHAWLPFRLPVLQSLVQQGYQIVIFTNQSAVGSEQQKKVYDRLSGLVTVWTQAGLPEPWVFAALGKDPKTGPPNPYRKPAIGMWQLLVNQLGSTPLGFYCGDAVGAGSWSDVDRAFASNAGLPFLTPEELFPSVYTLVTDPSTNQATAPYSQASLVTTAPYFSTYFPQGLPTNRAMLIFVGMPGSGKSTFYQRYLQPLGWVHVNRDTQKTKPRMLKLATSAITQGTGLVAIDNTNPTLEDRAEWLTLAQRYGLTVWCLYFVRDGVTQNKLRSKEQGRVPDIAYHSYYKRLVEPTMGEGFGNLVEVW